MIDEFGNGNDAQDRRERILRAAVQVFGEAGYRGATTRRIAQVAGVNEVTLFRHFGSKEELMREAIGVGVGDAVLALPDRPVDSASELTEFSRRVLEHLWGRRALIRACMGVGWSHPDILTRATERPQCIYRELRSYLERLRSAGLAHSGADVDTAATMLMAALWSDAMGREYMGAAFPYSMEEAPARYVGLILAAIGAVRSTSGDTRTNGGEIDAT